ncbi:hypothetical protein [Hathewaya massiliensis]|uniref:hypothetical protein n=1 Tax=Hathewaya massiliensis TaxID=1964382 RepID=UPI00115AC757|nr:hypothetical protein [Hathewaya massiliensis]
METLKKVIYITLNIIMFLAASFSLWIYLSHNEWVSWHENSGTQFLALLLITLPILLFVALGFKILSKKSTNITKENVRLPLYIIVGIVLPVVIDGSLSNITIFIGTICCVVACVVSLVEVVFSVTDSF